MIPTHAQIVNSNTSTIFIRTYTYNSCVYIENIHEYMLFICIHQQCAHNLH